MRAVLLLPLVLAACLSKPDRPSGADAAPDSRIDAPPTPDFVYRRDAEVGDINADGFDDLVRWGNVVEGEQPRVWVFYGSSGGVSPTPSLEIDVEFNGTVAWYEVLDVSVKEFRPVANPELIVLVAEDRQQPSGDDPVGRDLHVDVWNPITGGLTMPLGRSSTVAYDSLGGLARASTPAYIAERLTQGGTHEIIFGGLDVAWRLSNVTGASFGTPEAVELHDADTLTKLVLIQDLFDAPGIPDEHLVAVDQGLAWSSDGDAMGSPPPIYGGLGVPFAEGNRRRAVRHAANRDPMILAAEGQGSFILQIIEDQPPAAPVVFELDLQTEEPVDFAIDNLGGTGQIDVVTLDDNKLVGYIDLDLVTGDAMPTSILAGPMDLVGYNLIVIGNFSDASNGNEIYVLGDDVPMRCLVFTGTAFEAC